MTLNSYIYLKGVRTPLVVSRENGEAAQRVFDNTAIAGDTTVRLGNKSFRKSQINYIEVNPNGSEGEKWNNYSEQMWREGYEKRRSFLKLTPDQKASKMDLFELLFYISVARVPSKEETLRAYTIQLEFFKTNKTRMFCDPKLLHEAIPMEKRKLNLWESAGIRVVEGVVERDMNLA